MKKGWSLAVLLTTFLVLNDTVCLIKHSYAFIICIKKKKKIISALLEHLPWERMSAAVLPHQYKIKHGHARNQEEAPSSCVSAWKMWGLSKTQAATSRGGRADGTRGLEWTRHVCRARSTLLSPFSSPFSTAGELPNIPQVVFRQLLLKQKVELLLSSGWDINPEHFDGARLLLGRYWGLWTCATPNQNQGLSDHLIASG